MSRLDGIITSLIERQFLFHKGIAVQDIYKLLYQAVYGGEHFIGDKKAAKENLLIEIADLRLPKTSEIILPVMEPVFENLYRINLMPYLLCGYNPNHLADAFVQAQNIVFDTLIVQMADSFVAVNKKKKWFCQKGVITFFEMVEDKNFPPVHHSNSYRDIIADNLLERPHYRVLCLKRTSLE